MTSMLSPLQLIALVIILLPAVITDIKHRRIPNSVSLSGWLIGLILGAWLGGWTGLAESTMGLLMLLLLTVPFFFIGWMGAGDVKLIAAIGAIIGQGLALHILLGIVLSGLIMSLLILAFKGELGNTLRRLGISLGFTLSQRKPIYLTPTAAQKRLVIPYAVPIAAGTIGVVLLSYP